MFTIAWQVYHTKFIHGAQMFSYKVYMSKFKRNSEKTKNSIMQVVTKVDSPAAQKSEPS